MQKEFINKNETNEILYIKNYYNYSNYCTLLFFLVLKENGNYVSYPREFITLNEVK